MLRGRALRLHAQDPALRILIGRWGESGDVAKTVEQLKRAGAEDVATSLQESCRQIEALRPLLTAAASPVLAAA